MKIELGRDELLDQKLPVARRRPTVRCLIEIGGYGEPRYRSPAKECIAMVDSGANICAASSSVIPSGVFPVGFHAGGTNADGTVKENAVYWARIGFAGCDRRIELQAIGYEVPGMASPVLLGTPFLAFVGLRLDPIEREEYIWVYGNTA